LQRAWKEKAMIKLVLTDLDDTLISHGLPHASAKALAAIHTVLDAGVHFGPASGRMPWDIGWMFCGDAQCYATGVLVNGQMVFLDGELVREVPLPTGALEQVAECISTYPGAGLVLYEPGQTTVVGMDMEALQKHRPAFSTVDRVALHVPDRVWVKANVHIDTDDHDLTEDVRQEVQKLCPELDFVYPMSGPGLFDILPHGWSKQKGVEVLCRELDVKSDEVAVFGDSRNDLEMIEAYPNSVAVANACQEVLEAAGWIIGASADDAVAQALFEIATAANKEMMPSFMH
jgi:Cof subfamily protein (haloacid dehalogenase superfamily)